MCPSISELIFGRKQNDVQLLHTLPSNGASLATTTLVLPLDFYKSAQIT